MSWFNFHVTDTKDVTKQLTRIADLLELAISLQYNYTVTVPKDMTPAANEDSVSYASDEQLAKQEMIEEVKHYQHVADELEREGE